MRAAVQQSSPIQLVGVFLGLFRVSRGHEGPNHRVGFCTVKGKADIAAGQLLVQSQSQGCGYAQPAETVGTPAFW